MNQNILTDTLGKMDPKFTSNRFYYELQKVVGDDYTTSDVLRFLNIKCVQSKVSKRQWYKKTISTVNTPEVVTKDTININEQAAIELLKSKGYKILKALTKYEEL